MSLLQCLVGYALWDVPWPRFVKPIPMVESVGLYTHILCPRFYFRFLYLSSKARLSYHLVFSLGAFRFYDQNHIYFIKMSIYCFLYFGIVLVTTRE